MRHKFAICLFTVLGCVVLISGNEISSNGWIRQKREGKKTSAKYINNKNTIIYQKNDEKSTIRLTEILIAHPH